MNKGGWDVFICHASEDKCKFVKRFVTALKSLGVDAWYDDDEMSIGDSLSESIDKGLAESRFGIVVLSPNSLKKAWPKRELRGLVARDVHDDGVILPIWLGVTREEVMKVSPPLADLIALNVRDDKIEDILLKVLFKVRFDIYERYSREELINIFSNNDIRKFRQDFKFSRDPSVVGHVLANVRDWLDATNDLYFQIYDRDADDATDEIRVLLEEVGEIEIRLKRINELALEKEQRIADEFDRAADRAMR